MHYSSDVPLTIKALLYIPSTHNEKMGIGQEPYQISLYSRKVLIKANMQELLPRYLRFVKGVVDCEDIPLNISRETYQGSAHIEKLKATITKKIIKMLEDESKKDLNKYIAWYNEFNMFLKEGLVMDRENSESIMKLIRFSCNNTNQTISLDDYISRLTDKDQRSIFYLYAPKKDLAMNSPYMEPFKILNIPVLITEHHLDEMCLRNLGKYKDFQLVNIESDFENILKELEKRFPDKLQSKKADAISEADITPFCLWIKNEFGTGVTKVTTSKRNSEAPGVILGPMSSSMRQIMTLFDPENNLAKQNDMQIELNITHPVVKNINELRKTDTKTAGLLAKCLLDYIQIVACVPVDFSTAAERSLQVMKKLSDEKLGKPSDDKNDTKKHGRGNKQNVLNEAKNMGKSYKKFGQGLEFMINDKGEPVHKK